MFRLALTMLPMLAFTGLVAFATFWLVKRFQGALNSLAQVEYAYVRFRNGELVLRRRGFFGEKDVTFIPEQEILALPASTATAITLQGQSQWFNKETGQMVRAGSSEQRGIQTALRFAKATGLLEAEDLTR